MTKVTGIDAGGTAIRLVELDGSARRFKVSGIYTAPRVRVTSEAAAADVAEASVEFGYAFQESGATKDRVLYSVPGSRCVLRNIVIPFRGLDEIRKVLKYEAESHIHSHSIDEVVVDGIVVNERTDGTELFVAACPKRFLKPELDALSKAEVEPEVADLDASLLVAAGRSLGVFERTVSEEADEAGEAGNGNCLLLGIEPDAVLMAMVRDGVLNHVRVLRWGFERQARALAQQIGRSSVEVVHAMQQQLGGDEWTEVPLDALGLLGDEAEPPVESLGGGGNGNGNGNGNGFDAHDDGEDEDFVVIDDGPGFLDDRRTGALELRDDELSSIGTQLGEMVVREIYRFVSGLGPNVEPSRILLTGSGAMLPTLGDTIRGLTETEVEVLDLMGRAGDAAAADPRPDLDLAFAAAMAGLGASTSSLNFRQEELAFKRRFERLKFPLAVCALLAAFTLFFMNMILIKAIRHGEGMIGTINQKDSRGTARNRRVIYGGLMFALGSPELRGYIRTHLDQEGATQLLRELPKYQAKDRIAKMLSFLKAHKRSLAKKTGNYANLKLESGLAVLVPFSEAVDKAAKDETIDRFVILSLDLSLGLREGNRYLKFKIAYFSADGREANSRFQSLLKRELLAPDKPFVDIKWGGTSEKKTDFGYEYDYELKLKKDNIGVFQPPPPQPPAPGK